MYLRANINSFVFDYCARQKIGGTSFAYFILRQLPVLAPSNFEVTLEWLLPRALELIYTTHDLTPLARDCGYDGVPFAWDEARRFQLRCELDALFFHLYLPSESDGRWRKVENETDEQLTALKAAFPHPRDAVSFILDQFPIVRRKDEAKYGGYRTKERILEVYDGM